MKNIIFLIIVLLNSSCVKNNIKNHLELFALSNNKEKIIKNINDFGFIAEQANSFEESPITWSVGNGDTSLSYLTNFDNTNVTYGKLVINNVNEKEIVKILNIISKAKSEKSDVVIMPDSSVIYFYKSDSTRIKYKPTDSQFIGEYLFK